MKKPSFIQRLLHPREEDAPHGGTGGESATAPAGASATQGSSTTAGSSTAAGSSAVTGSSATLGASTTTASKTTGTSGSASDSRLGRSGIGETKPRPLGADRASGSPPPASTPSRFSTESSRLASTNNPPSLKPTKGGKSEGLLSRKDDVAVRFQEGFRDLGNLLQNINHKLEEHNDTNRILVENVRPIPGLLSRVSDQLQEQQETSVALNKTLGELRDASENQTTLMRGIGESQKLTVDSFQKTQTRALNAFYRAQKETYDVFRKGQVAQAKQFESALVKTQRNFTRMLMIFFAAVMVAVTAAVIFSRPTPGPAEAATGTGIVGSPLSDSSSNPTPEIGNAAGSPAISDPTSEIGTAAPSEDGLANSED